MKREFLKATLILEDELGRRLPMQFDEAEMNIKTAQHLLLQAWAEGGGTGRYKFLMTMPRTP